VVNLLTAKRRAISQTKRDMSTEKRLVRRTPARCAHDGTEKSFSDGELDRSAVLLELETKIAAVARSIRRASDLVLGMEAQRLLRKRGSSDWRTEYMSAPQVNGCDLLLSIVTSI
jgi:hypothetical protein